MSAVDALTFRRVMGNFPTGVSIVTTEEGGTRHGMTANAITSVSLDPVMLLVCLMREARTAGAVQRRGRFAVNLLRDDQEELSRHFAEPGGDHFAGLETVEGPEGLPLLPGALAYLVCRVESVVPAGDHDVVFGEVEDCRVNGGNPLLFFLGGYRRLPGPSRLG
jgi:3-hydroxy-9,10-secoandrosta-1,3,5(10)-triene-9,17-dione monooxygenase reductase component